MVWIYLENTAGFSPRGVTNTSGFILAPVSKFKEPRVFSPRDVPVGDFETSSMKYSAWDH
ncbi:MAG: hypothetical protein HJJLKODD_01102 [Phycisphaerae bacterium]|nr:hypothetical protein [Phycisphaerae bacterium]